MLIPNVNQGTRVQDHFATENPTAGEQVPELRSLVDKMLDVINQLVLLIGHSSSKDDKDKLLGIAEKYAHSTLHISSIIHNKSESEKSCWTRVKIVFESWGLAAPNMMKKSI